MVCPYFGLTHLWGREGETWLAQRCIFFLFLFFFLEVFSQSSVFSKEILLSATLFLYLQIIFIDVVIMETKALV